MVMLHWDKSIFVKAVKKKKKINPKMSTAVSWIKVLISVVPLRH